MSQFRVVPSVVAALCGFAWLCLALPAAAAPSWWRVSNGRSEVWIIGAPRITPRGFSWDTSTLEKRLGATNALIVGPQPHGGAAARGVALLALASLISPTPMEDSLPADLRRDFVAARQAIGQDARRYSNWKPAIAGMKLSDDFLKATNLQSGQVDARVRQLARSRGLAEAPAGEIDQVEMVTAAKTLGPKGQEACLAASVHDMAIGADRLRALAEGWAKGDVATPPIDAIDRACLTAAPAFGAAFDRAAVQDSAAVAKALSTTQHGVAEFDLPTLIMPGGVLDRLRARGLQVSGPME